MRQDEFVMRGQTASGLSEVLNFSGFKPGYAYRLVELQLYPSANIGVEEPELCASITAGKAAIDPINPDFNNDGLIATAMFENHNSAAYGPRELSIINDTFLITQNLILTVKDNSSNARPVNWQCKFMPVKMNKAEEAVTNYKQFTILDE